MSIIKSLLFTAFALAAAPAFAATAINQVHPLDAHARLRVSNVSGAVVIQTWDKPQVRVTGTLGNNARLKVEGDSHDLEIKVKGPDDDGGGFWGHGDDMGPSTLQLTVPGSVNLKLHTVSATIQADGLAGGEFDAKTVSGNITVDGNNPDIEIDSVSGDVHLKGTAREVDITTVSGDIRVAHVAHEAEAQSVSGDIRLSGGPLDEADMESVSGDLYLDAGLTANAKAKLHSMSGDIHLTFAGKPAATLDASTFSGDIHSPWGQVDEPGYGPGSKLHTRVGDGGARVTLKTFSGDVFLRQGH